MPKRKREDDTSVEAIFARCRAELYSALKTAKGFERQRQSKRLRDTNATPEKRSRVEKEVVVLKSLDLQQTAHAHLCSSLLRIKAVAESDRLPAEIKAGVAKPDLTDEERALLHNVTSSLYNKKPVKSVVEKAVEAVCRAIGVPVPEKKGKGKKGVEEEKVNGEGKGAPVKSEKSSAEEKKEKGKKQEKAEKVAEAGKPGKKENGKDKNRQEEDEEIDEEEEEKAVSQLDDLLGLGSSDENEDEEEDVLVKGKTRRPLSSSKELDPMEITTDEDGEEDSGGEEEFGSSSNSDDDGFEGFSGSNHEDMSNSDGEDEEVSEAESSASSVNHSPPKKKAATSHTAKLKPTDSTFLPTLMGGYISGSESASDIDTAPARKNRRGQRARRKIWEKKYKESAKHLQKQTGKGRDAGWDLKRGAVDGDSKPWKRGIRNPLLDKSKGEGSGAGGGTGKAPAPKKEPPKRARDDTGELHPSWAARRRQKEQERLTAPFQGKKITFD